MNAAPCLRAPLILTRPRTDSSYALGVLAVALGLAGVAAPRAACAQAAPTAADVAEGRRHFERGIQLFDDGDHDGALAEFQRAWDLSHRPSVLFNIATTCLEMRRYGDALDALHRFLAEPGVPAPERQQAERRARELEQLVARVRVTVDPPEAILTLDGRRQRAGEDLLVGPGTHRVEATREGFAAAAEEFIIASGQTRALRLSLHPLVAAPVVVVTRPTPDPVGPATPPPPSNTARTLAWVAGGGALVMLGGGVIALAVREGAVGRYNDDARCLPNNGATRAQTCGGDESTAGTAGALAVVGFVAGGALAVTSAVLFLTAPTERRAATARFGCGLGPAAVGVTCGGTF